MNGIGLSEFYNHCNFMNDVAEGERIIVRSENELRSMKKQTTDIKVGDKILATDRATYIEGTVGQVLEIISEGPFLKFKIKWEVSKIPTYERLSDIKLI